LSKREFTIANEYQYNRTSPVRWIVSHVLRYKRYIASFVLASIVTLLSSPLSAFSNHSCYWHLCFIQLSL